jgi:Mandelate racemase / muconate lactonizing enzyme, N-terminal domain
MKIERAYTRLTCPGRNFFTLKILTDEGVFGLGDGTLNGRELAVKVCLDDYVIPCLVGSDPRNIDDIWPYLYRAAYWRSGPGTIAAIAAVDVALWDIKGKLAQIPWRSRRPVGAELWSPGADGTCGGDRRGLPAHLTLQGRIPRNGRSVRVGRRYRREARGATSVRARLLASRAAV